MLAGPAWFLSLLSDLQAHIQRAKALWKLVKLSQAATHCLLGTHVLKDVPNTGDSVLICSELLLGS
jgi:hypothetical protein